MGLILPKRQWFPAELQKTFRYHFPYALSKAPVSAGIGLASFIAVKTLGANGWLVALLTSSGPMGNLLGGLWGGRVAAGKKTTYVLAAETLSNIALLLVFFSRSALSFTILIAVAQLARSPVTSALSGIWRANYHANLRNRIIGWIEQRILLIAAGLSFLFGHILEVDPYAYRWIFPLMALVSQAGCVYFRRLQVKEHPQGKPSPILRGWSVLLRRPEFARYELNFFLHGTANFMVVAALPLFLEEELGFDYRQASFVLVLAPNLLGMAFMGFWSRLLDRQNPLVMRLWLNCIWLISPLLLANAHGFLGVAAARAAQGMILGGILLVWRLGVNYFAHTREVAVYMSVHQALTGLRGITAPSLGILLAHAIGYRATFMISFALGVCASIVIAVEIILESRTRGLPTYNEAEASNQPTLPPPQEP
jgi:predicted MFS family arabinose efflux permease